MRLVANIKRSFFIILTILFIFSLHHNGVFKSFRRAISSSEYINVKPDGVVFRNSKGFSGESPNPKCEPKQKVVFLKTHKTASSTAAAVIERYGYNRNLTFAVSNVALKFAHSPLFEASAVKEASDSAKGWKRADGYHLLTNHARFQKAEMDKVVHNATYVTILRDPVDQLESAFGYFDLGLPMGFKRENQMEEFMKDPARHFGAVKRGYWQFAKNNQLFDLGLDHQYHEDPEIIRDTIEQLDRDFDHVMIKEYFDESLVLLKDLLCWDFDDILYISKSIRSQSHRLKMSEDLRQRIREWNSADQHLYQHFRAVLLKKIAAYGPKFQADLAEFRRRLGQVANDCIDQKKNNTTDEREDKSVLKPDAPAYCQELLMGDVEYTRFIQRMMWDKCILMPNPRVYEVPHSCPH